MRGFLLTAWLATTVVSAQPYDLLIRGARVIDGAGNPWFRADVGVRAGRIAALGRLTGATATRVIEARGRFLAPGFIDVHTHIEGQIEKFPDAANFVRDGVTTVVTGNCGGSALKVGEFFERLEKLGLGLNVATLVGHNTVRAAVMGSANRLATDEELQRMEALVEAGMREGAVGFSTGLIYIPGTYSNSDEVVRLAKPAAKYRGVYASHMRDEGEFIADAIHEAARVGVENGMRVQLSHFKIDNRRLWGASVKSLALVEEYRKKGLDVVIDQYPYDRSSTGMSIRLPSWALADGPEKVRERLTTPASRAEVAKGMEQILKNIGQPDYTFSMVASFPPNREYEGKTIPEITGMKGREATLPNQIETVLDLMVAGGAQMVYQSMGMEDVERILRYPNTAIASDGFVVEPGKGMPHPRSFATNARVLAEYVKARGVLTWEDAIRRMTSLPARTFGFQDRGLIREGMAADLLLIDPENIAEKSTFVQPHQNPEGFAFVIVNGTITVEEGLPIGARSGRVLRRQ